jgi:ABC-type lipoprotein release transport system permease subunit
MAAVLMTVAGLSGLLPAIRASRADGLRALRGE